MYICSTIALNNMCSYLFDRDSSLNKDMAEEETSNTHDHDESNDDSQDSDNEESVGGRQANEDSPMDDYSHEENEEEVEEEEEEDEEEEGDTDDGDILGVEADEVVRENADLIDEVKEKVASTSIEIKKHRLRKEAVSYLREQFIDRLLSVADMKARWDNDEYFEKWYDQAQELLDKDPNLDLDSAMRTILKKHKEVLHKQLSDAMMDYQESSEESSTESE